MCIRASFREGTTAWSKSLEQTEKYEKGEMDDPEKTSPKRKKQSDKADSQFAGGNRRFDGEDGQFAEANKRSVRKAGSSGNVMDGDGGMATQDPVSYTHLQQLIREIYCLSAVAHFRSWIKRSKIV